jgi:hypothetical protein
VLVGETGILGAAGRLLAACRGELRDLEFDSSGMKQGDVLSEPIAPVVGNRAPATTGEPGLGVAVDARRLEVMAEARSATWLQVQPRSRREWTGS